MAKSYYDRYQSFKADGKYEIIPFIKIPEKPTDEQVTWRKSRDRMDKLSQEFYGNPYHGWLIMLANPQYGGLEDNIRDNDTIIVPFPFNDT